MAIGEAGLDYHYDNAPRDAQREGFLPPHRGGARDRPAAGYPRPRRRRRHRRDPRGGNGEGGLPLRSPLLLVRSRPGRRGLALGGYVSFSGILTFKRSDELRAIAAEVPLDRLLVETDAPYLAPVPHRGHRNEPAYVVETAKVLAEVRGLDAEAIAAATTDNFFRLFTKVPRAVSDRACVPSILGCGSSPRRAAHRQRLGRLRSGRAARTAARAARCSSSASTPATARRACWSTPARTCAPSCSPPASTSSTPSSTPTPTPTTSTASTTCAPSGT